MSHHRRVVNSPELYRAAGFSHVASARGAAVVHVAGQVALDSQCTAVIAEDENA